MLIELNNGIGLYHADCLDILPTLEADSIDAVVTDPPYGIGFMGKHWDHGVPGVEFWQQMLRVLKPGGHLLAFGGTRKYHRMVCAIEDAGFEVRDCIQWLYGSGFPKSHDVSKGIDRAAGEDRMVVGVAGKSGSARSCMAGDFVGGEYMATAAATPEAAQWEGWGTALKPANEPIVLARKPLSEKTVAANVLRWGTGAINVGACRVGTDTIKTKGFRNGDESHAWDAGGMFAKNKDYTPAEHSGRWPANVLHDGSEEVVGAFPETASGKAAAGGHLRHDSPRDTSSGWGMRQDQNAGELYGDSGSAARFFYCAKAGKKDRNGSKHPTVKPIKLIAYLCRLITPPGGTVLDPFAGSGTTGAACVTEGFDCIMVEREAEYVEDIRRRMLDSSVEMCERATCDATFSPEQSSGESIRKIVRPAGPTQS